MLFSRTRGSRAAAVGLLVFAVTSLAQRALPGQTPPGTGDLRGPDVFKIAAEVKPVDIPYPGGYTEILTKEDGTRWVRVLELEAVDSHPLLPNARQDGYSFHYASVSHGDMIWLVDGFYRFETEVRPPAFLRISDSELPEGIAPVRGTYLFPMGGGGHLYRVDGSGYDLSVSDQCTTDRDGRLRVSVDLSGKYRLLTPAEFAKLRERDGVALVPEGSKTRDRATIRVKEGDFLRLGDKLHRVRRIVPPNPRVPMTGWIEIDQEAL